MEMKLLCNALVLDEFLMIVPFRWKSLIRKAKFLASLWAKANVFLSTLLL